MTTRHTLSPIEIQGHTFRKVVRGFDPEDVKLYLAAIAESYQEAVLNNARMQKEMETLNAGLDEFRRRENLLKEALYLAQKTADEVKAQAIREAQSIVEEAQVKGESALQDAQIRAHEVERQIMDLRLERENLLGAIKDLVRRVSALVEAIEGKKSNENAVAFGKGS